MSKSAYIGAYWGPRAEPLDACTSRLTSFISALGELDPILSTWYHKGDTRHDALSQTVDLTPEGLAAVLSSAQTRRDDNHAIIDELGFSASMWNGQEPGVSLTARCGARFENGVIPNSVVLKLPSSDVTHRLYHPDVVRAVFSATVRDWQPEWATFTSHTLRRDQKVVPGHPIVGWLTYLAGTTPKALPAQARAEPLDAGVLVTVGTPGDPIEPDLLAAVRRSLGLD